MSNSTSVYILCLNRPYNGESNGNQGENLYDNYNPSSNGHTNGRGSRHNGSFSSASGYESRRAPPPLPYHETERPPLPVKDYRGPPPLPPPRTVTMPDEHGPTSSYKSYAVVRTETTTIQEDNSRRTMPHSVSSGEVINGRNKTLPPHVKNGDSGRAFRRIP